MDAPTDADPRYPPTFDPDLDRRAVTRQLSGIVLDRRKRGRWWAALAASGALVALLLVAMEELFRRGIGIWGINNPVHWGLAIINTVWWAGIAHAGTMISAFLLLLGRQWRNSLNRFAEAMTLFAVLCASLFPILHLGRPTLFYWMFPYANTMELQPQVRSPLFWDVTGFFTYLLASLIFWYVGLLPDLALLRDRARGRGWRMAYGLLALGWRGSARHWRVWRQAYLALAAVAVPLVILVNSGTAMLFAASSLPGWHSTLLPAWFVLSAVFSGFAVVAMLAVALRVLFDLDEVLTDLHLDYLGRAILFTGLLTAYGYAFLAFHAVYSGDERELATLADRFTGEYAWAYWVSVLCNIVVVQGLWWRRWRRSPWALFAVGLSVTVGMWFERYMFLVTGLYRGFIPALWRPYDATFWDWSLLAGTVGLFLFLFVLFVRVLPAISVSEVKEVLHEQRRDDRRD